ncbi:MAG TPA: DUF5675 family protein [Vicinamibacterales bacterium]|jgi:hypothetical protein|nr:DUF5675 family protein [Vicinamibacterales bacterium]
MNLKLQRQPAVDHALPGDLFVNGVRFCCTLENADLAIVAGRYPVTMEVSPDAQDTILFTPDQVHFTLPTLQHVPPHRTGIHIHSANVVSQLKGCIAVGRTWTGNWLGTSQATLIDLFNQIAKALSAGEDVWIDVLDPVKPGGETKQA